MALRFFILLLTLALPLPLCAQSILLSQSTQTVRIPTAPGVLLTPTAYRGNRKEGIGLALDFNASYYIGRLYGKNSLDWTTKKTNFIDRVGVWLLTADGKMQIQKEGRYLPAVAVGAEGTFLFKDAPQPDLQTPQATVKVDKESTKALSGAYFVVSKRFWPRILAGLGWMGGNSVDKISFLSEFLTPEALNLSGHPNQRATSDSLFFTNLILYPHWKFPVELEYLKPTGAPASPYLLNLRLGRLLHMNFDLAYLKFKGGWDLLGVLNFRYSYFPKPQ
ncbi:MAG: hypothetical protein HY402_06715 [Elusimicrobia bacterium]|nr:hypothetical protein [Elusimicrobiota bacterium]